MSRCIQVLFCLLAVLSCTRDKSPLQPLSGEFPLVQVIENRQDFARTAIEIDPFVIDSVKLDGDLFSFYVSYGGGCREHQFSLYSTNGIYLSDPPQGDVYLGHDGNGDTCEALLHKKVVFDLTPLLQGNPHGMGLRLHQFEENEPFDILWWRTTKP
ncbi:hypothetical protein JW998_03880 [candidate division KSB1 bacterium]|nr:hypothetical protein [candidate division KSB1 bacterium]